MQLATADIFRAKWTDEIHDEWIRSVLANRSDVSPDALARTKRLMNDAVEDCLIAGYEFLIPTINLPDPNDRHVVSAAIHGKADAIVTFNKKDFPIEELKKYGLETIHPDDFISYQEDLRPGVLVLAAKKVRARLINPAMSPEEYLDTLRRQSLAKTCATLEPFAAVI